jgi:hypothetical protein
MQIRLIVCVRCTCVGSPSEAPERESSPACPQRRAGQGTGRRPRGATRRAARLHPNPGGRGTRRQPLDLRPSRAPADRDDRDAVGLPLDPRRRAPSAAHRGSSTTAPARGKPSTSRTTTSCRGGGRRANPNRTRRWHEFRSNRASVQRRRRAHSAPRGTVVALNRTRGTPPRSTSRAERPNVQPVGGSRNAETTLSSELTLSAQLFRRAIDSKRVADEVVD